MGHRRCEQCSTIRVLGGHVTRAQHTSRIVRASACRQKVRCGQSGDRRPMGRIVLVVADWMRCPGKQTGEGKVAVVQMKERGGSRWIISRTTLSFQQLHQTSRTLAIVSVELVCPAMGLGEGRQEAEAATSVETWTWLITVSDGVTWEMGKGRLKPACLSQRRKRTRVKWNLQRWLLCPPCHRDRPCPAKQVSVRFMIGASCALRFVSTKIESVC